MWEAIVKREGQEDLIFSSEERQGIGEGHRFVSIRQLEGEVWILRDEVTEIRVRNATPVLPQQTGI